MFAYRPGDTLGHRLDPRAKLAVQAGLAAAAFAHPNPTGLAIAGLAALACLRAAGLGVREALWPYRFAFPFLFAAPALAAVSLAPPYLRPADAVRPALLSARTLPVFAAGAAYVRTTPARDSRAAVTWLVPGKAGRFLGLAVGLVFRFLPALRRDLLSARAALRARLGEERPLRERMGLLAAAGFRRALGRADRLALALRARCLAWNPTHLPMRMRARDGGALALALGLAAWAVWGTLWSGFPVG